MTFAQLAGDSGTGSCSGRAGCPLLGYERLVGDWRNLGYEDEVLEKVFHRNTEAFLAGLGR